MRILFLHLSDLHIKDMTAFDEFRIKKMLDSLRMGNSFDRMVLILSGDIAQSGEKQQYAIASKLIGTIFTHIKRKKIYQGRIDVVCVPGNHDIAHPTPPRTSAELNEIFSNKKYSALLDDELKKLENFFYFSHKSGCFIQPSLFERKMLQYDDFTIEVNLVNSAAFSLRSDEDKGLHYINQHDINSLNTPTNADFVISVMHHAPDWFIDDQKDQIEKALWCKSSLIFIGHEHRQGLKSVEYTENSAAFVHAGGALCYNENWNESEFEFGILNTETFDYEYFGLRWNNAQSQYESIRPPKTFSLRRKPSVEKRLSVTDEFLQSMKEDRGHTVSDKFTDYFVFPRLERDSAGEQNAKEILTTDNFLAELEAERRIIITGANGSGKSTLLKHIFIELADEKCVIFCDIDSIKKKDSKKIVKHVFEDIYGTDPSDYVRFLQLPPEEKVLIIDDIDQIRPQTLDAYISSVSGDFGYMVFATKKTLSLDMIERMRSSLNTSKNICKYKVSPFYTDKRKELIFRVISCKSDGEENIDQIVDTLCDAIRTQKRFITFSPDFIVSFAEFYYKNLGLAFNSDSSVFSKVFEANITAALSPYQTSEVSVDKIFTLISLVAHHIHFHKLYPISSNEIIGVINAYNKDSDDDVDPLRFIETIKNAKIMVEDPNENGYRFSNRSQLAYFVAVAVNSFYQETGDQSDLEYILKYSCFSINADILLFISYITDNPRVLQLILNMTEELTADWLEFDFNEHCPNFLKTQCCTLEQLSIESKEKQEQKEIEDEKEVCEQLEVVDVYDYSEDDVLKITNQIIRALSLLSAVARALPSFEHKMKGPMKSAFVNVIYTLPNMIFLKWASEVDKVYDELINFLRQEWRTSYRHQGEADSDDIEVRFQITAILLLLDIYNMAAAHATKDNSFKYLENYQHDDNMTYSIEHLMMLEKRKLPKEFADTAVKLFEKCESFLPKEMIYHVVHHAMVHMKSLKYQQRDQLNSTFYKSAKGKQKQAEMLVERTKKIKHTE